MRGNCLLWALGMYFRHGGYIAMRRSHQWRYVPHFLWSKDLITWLGFAPVHPASGPLVGLLKWWFRGEVTPEHPEAP